MAFGRTGGNKGRRRDSDNIIAMRTVRAYLELPVGGLQQLLGLVSCASGGQHELVDHHLFAQRVHGGRQKRPRKTCRRAAADDGYAGQSRDRRTVVARIFRLSRARARTVRGVREMYEKRLGERTARTARLRPSTSSLVRRCSGSGDSDEYETISSGATFPFGFSLGFLSAAPQ